MNTVDQTVLTEVRQVRLGVQSVMRQGGRLGIGISIGGICPRQRVWIDGIGATGLIVVKIQPLEHLIALLYLIVGNDSFVHPTLLRLLQRTILRRVMINDHIAADIEHICTGVGFLSTGGSRW